MLARAIGSGLASLFLIAVAIVVSREGGRLGARPRGRDPTPFSLQVAGVDLWPFAIGLERGLISPRDARRRARLRLRADHPHPAAAALHPSVGRAARRLGGRSAADLGIGLVASVPGLVVVDP